MAVKRGANTSILSSPDAEIVALSFARAIIISIRNECVDSVVYTRRILRFLLSRLYVRNSIFRSEEHGQRADIY